MREKTLFNIDVILIFSSLALMVIGVLFVYSSGVSSAGIVFSREYIRQIIWAGTGVILLSITVAVDYARFRFLAPYIYFFFIALLILTLFIGERVNGAKSWLGFFDFGIQPSEFAKIGLILFLSSYFAGSGPRVDTLTPFLIGLGITFLPILLVLVQPDMGTSLVYIPIFLSIAFIARARIRYLVFILLVGIIFLVFSILPALVSQFFASETALAAVITNRYFLLYAIGAVVLISLLAGLGFFIFKRGYFYWLFYGFTAFFFGLLGSIGARMILKDYQIMRLIVFLNPNIDPQGAGWNIIQSITAVGSGGFSGKGFLEGTQSHYQYLPQQSTDFIFSIIAEEWGFLGSLAVFVLFLAILVRGIMIIGSTKDRFATYVAAGVVGMFFFHFVVNIGMAVGIMPITGIPLFFLSYGGSSLWTGLIAIGLLVNIDLRRQEY